MQVAQTAIKRVFLIDDDADDCEMFEQVITSLFPETRIGYTTSTESLFFNLLKFLPDLIFLDINIPVKNGFEWLKELKEDNDLKRIPIIMYSCSDHPTDINVSYGLGAALYFHKPYTVKDMEKSVRFILSLDWYRPADITANHYRNGHYFSVSVKN
jgi:DNA-binding response OmpR family regulator